MTPVLVPVESRHSVDRKTIEATLAEPLEPAEITTAKGRAGTR